jgi:hypothetical protein
MTAFGARIIEEVPVLGKARLVTVHDCLAAAFVLTS